MTSHANHAATEGSSLNPSFGLTRAGAFLPQGRMPAVTLTAKYCWSQRRDCDESGWPWRSLRALSRSGALELMKAGVDTISYFQVDNPLVVVSIREFIGWHRLQGRRCPPI